MTLIMLDLPYVEYPAAITKNLKYRSINVVIVIIKMANLCMIFCPWSTEYLVMLLFKYTPSVLSIDMQINFCNDALKSILCLQTLRRMKFLTTLMLSK